MHKNHLLGRIQQLTHPLAPLSGNTPPRLAKLKNIHCIAFDFYGTMFISAVGDIGIDEEQKESNTQYFTEALESSGFGLLQNDTAKRGIQIFEQKIAVYRESAHQAGIDYPEPDIRDIWLDVLTELRHQNLIRGDITMEKAQLLGIEFEFRVNDVWPVPDLKNVLTQLLKKNYKLGIISNSQFYTPLTFEAALGSDPSTFGFEPDLLVWSYKARRKKPSEAFYQLFIQAAAKKNIKAEEILFVGNDIRKDIQPAKEIGMKTALYMGDRRSIRHEEDDLSNPSFTPEIIINDLAQLIDCL